MFIINLLKNLYNAYRDIILDKKQKRVAFLASLGSGLEYYDFVIYGMLAQFFSTQFFPKTNHLTALIQVFVIFALGYLVRPIGGTIFGMVGDYFGRKTTFLISIILMGSSTFFMGMIPTYQYIGIYASLIFLVLRLIQGISFGAELPSSLTFLAEHSGAKDRGLLIGIMITSVGTGALLGSGFTFVLCKLLGKSNMVNFGWRIPFLLGGMLAIIAYFFRKKTEETPIFLKEKKHEKIAIIKLLRKDFKNVVVTMLIIILPASLIIFGVAFPSFASGIWKYKTTNIYFALVVGEVFSIGLIFLFGWLSDKIGRKKQYTAILILFCAFGYSMFGLLEKHTFFHLILFVIIFKTFIAAMAGNYFAIMTENFITNIRNTGIAFCYNCVFAAAAFIPLLLLYIYKQTHSIKFISVFFVLLSVISLIGMIFIEDRTKKTLT